MVFQIMENNKLESFLNQIDEVTKNPEKYLSLQEDQAELIKVLTRNLYNFTKKKENTKKKNTDVLNDLVIVNLDEEQIWQQIELQNNSICESLVSNIAHLLAKKNSLQFPIKAKEIKTSKLNNSDSQIIQNDEKIEKDIKTKMKKKTKRQKIKSSVVDDKFFKLYEMDNFLKKIEQGEETDDSDDQIDYFIDEDTSDVNDDNKEELHYGDFFDEPVDEENSNEESEGNSEADQYEKPKTKKVTFKENEYEDGSIEEQKGSESSEIDASDLDEGFISNNREGEYSNDEMNDADDEEQSQSDTNVEENKVMEQSSNFEARQERLKTRIRNLEEEALQEKPWQLKGEITASNRPQNSLLEEYVEFDIASRPVPVFTEKTTLKLEDVIIQRIKDKAWDDVIRKIKPLESEIEYKKKLVLDQEKSKLSLAQIYEQEYLKQLDTKNEGAVDKPEIEPPEHQEIRIMMNKLFSKLDALSNFHFTPKQVEPEVKIISNLPAINMEEVAPVAASDATLLAPEEVKPKLKGNLLGKSERTKTDKKREKRQKKLKQKLKFKQMEAKAKLKSGKSDSKDLETNKMSKSLLQKITKSSNIIQLEKNKDDKYVKSSTAFFSKLQNETSSKKNHKGLHVKTQKLGKKGNVKKLKSS